MNSLARAAALLLGLAACGDGPHGDVERSDDPSTTVELLDAGVQVVECDQAPNGTPCGRPGADQHCLFGACLRNACGDGVKTAEEACDDGNERDHDGCSARCRMEPPPGCGNGLVEPGESCDDGNFADGDGCSSRCTPDTTGGTPDGDAGDDGGAPSVEDAGTEGGPTDSGAPMGDSGVDDRAGTGPAADAPCVAAWQTDARSSVNAEVQARFTDLAYPSGRAYFLLDCDRTYLL